MDSLPFAEEKRRSSEHNTLIDATGEIFGDTDRGITLQPRSNKKPAGTCFALFVVSFAAFVTIHQSRSRKSSSGASGELHRSLLGPGCTAMESGVKLLVFDNFDTGATSKHVGAFNAVRVAVQMRRALIGPFVSSAGRLMATTSVTAHDGTRHFTEYCNATRIFDFFPSVCFATGMIVVEKLCSSKNSLLACASDSCADSPFLEQLNGKVETLPIPGDLTDIAQYFAKQAKFQEAVCVFVSGYGNGLGSAGERKESGDYIASRKLRIDTLFLPKTIDKVSGTITESQLKEARKKFRYSPWLYWQEPSKEMRDLFQLKIGKVSSWSSLAVQYKVEDGAPSRDSSEACDAPQVIELIASTLLTNRISSPLFISQNGRLPVPGGPLANMEQRIASILPTNTSVFSQKTAFQSSGNALVDEMVLLQILANAKSCVRIGFNSTFGDRIDAMRLEHRQGLCSYTAFSSDIKCSIEVDSL